METSGQDIEAVMEAQLATYSLMALEQDLPDELPSWAFEEDVLGGFDHFIDTNVDTTAESTSEVAGSQVHALEGPSSPVRALRQAAEDIDPSSSRPPSGPSRSNVPVIRKQRQNREAQQRFRERQRARTQTLEAQVAATTSQLQQLQASQRQLEARNALLESVASQDTKASEVTAGWASPPSSPSGAQKTISLTLIGDQPLVRTVQDIGRMPFTEFAALYAGYAQKMSHCLLVITQVGSRDDVMRELQTWTCECASLILFLAVGHLKNFIAFCSSRLDGQMGPTVNQLSDAWYQEYTAALKLTEGQQVDLMLLRRLFYAKLGSLRRERKELLQQVPTGAAETAPEASDRLAAIMTAAQQLHDNSAAEFRTYMQLTAAYRRGVLTVMQQALCVVKGFPYIADTARTLEILAGTRREPPSILLTQPLGQDDFEHNAKWQRVVNYLKAVNKDNLHVHVPFATEL